MVGYIKAMIDGDAAWEDPAVLEIRNSILITRNTASILDLIQKLLDDIRATGGLRARLATPPLEYGLGCTTTLLGSLTAARVLNTPACEDCTPWTSRMTRTARCCTAWSSTETI